MRYGQMLRNHAKASFAVVMLGMAGACADNQTAPVNRAANIKGPANFTFTGTQVTFRVDNAEGAVQRIGNHVVSIPAGAICDLETSDYGPSYWDAPCDPLVGSVEITGTLLEDPDGQPYLDFQPAMRFSPDKDVVLFVRQGRNSGQAQLKLTYCNNVGFCYEEQENDLRPFRVGNSPVLGRRLKHFSGYAVTTGESCPGSVTDNGDGTYWCDEGGFMRKSGYMVASGEDIKDVMKDDETVKDEKEKEKDQQ